MSEWREQSWRIPRRGEIVKNQDGLLGRVIKSEGTLQKRVLWIEDVKGTEIYSGEPAELFEAVDVPTTCTFQNERYNLRGFVVGALCAYKGDNDIPLQILQMDWNSLRDKMMICLKDLRQFKGEPMKTDDEDLLTIFDQNYPPIESIFSSHDTGLKWRIDVSLAEKDVDSWTNCGSPWEFISKEDALNEVEIWKARLKIRRVSSVLNIGWNVQFPAWTIETIVIDNEILTRVKKADSSVGAPGYFKTALHASVAMNMISPDVWKLAGGFSSDKII